VADILLCKKDAVCGMNIAININRELAFAPFFGKRRSKKIQRLYHHIVVSFCEKERRAGFREEMSSVLRFKVDPMDLTIIYDNTAFDPRLGAGWGFSCLVRHGETSVLFDTGADGDILLANMEKLCIDPESVDFVFISHLHLDHVGGLASFRNVNHEAQVYFPDTAPSRAKHKMIALREQQRLLPGMYTTGILEGIEQSLLVWTSRGWAVISGCAHPGVGRILETAAGFGTIRALIGGLHDFQEFELVRGLELICPTHCTMYGDQLRKLFPEECIQGGAGRSLVLD